MARKNSTPTVMTDGDWDVLEKLAKDTKSGKICDRCGAALDGKAPGKPRLCDACTPTRGKKLLLALNDWEHVTLKQAAAKAGQPLAAYIRAAALRDSQRA